MQLYYSGATDNNKQQKDPALSLGGLISSSRVPNGSLNGVFSAISREDVKSLVPETKLIVLTNTTGSEVNGVKIWTDRGIYSTLLIAVMAPAFNAQCARYEFEKIDSSADIPYQSTLQSKEGTDNAVSIGTLTAGSSVGIWIQRNLDTTAFNELDGLVTNVALTNDQLIGLLTNQDPSTQFDQPKLNISWD